jgi:peptidoglycan/LPS O-acetylase OafA/YrhL
MAGALSRPGTTLLVVVPIYALMGVGAALGTSEHDWLEFCWYLGYFLIGFVLVMDDRFIAAVRRDLWPAGVLAVITTTMAFAGIPAPLESFGRQGFGPTALAMGAVFAAEGWAWTLLILNLGLRVRRPQRPLSEHLGDAVLPVYVVHQPVILAVAFFVVQWPSGIVPKWHVVLGLAAPITAVLVELALRARITRRLLGVRVRRVAPIAWAPARRAAGAAPGLQSGRRHHAGRG